MKVFLIVVAAIVLVFAIIFSISADFTIIFDNGWTTKVKILFIEKNIKLSKLLSFLVAPEEAGRQTAEKAKEKHQRKDEEKELEKEKQEAEKAKSEDEIVVEAHEAEESTDGDDKTEKAEKAKSEKPAKAKKQKDNKNFVKRILDEDGIAGLMTFVSNLIQTANSAVTTLIKGLHIYSLYVKMIIGGGDAATIAEKYGSICGWYYPIKGIILNQMKVDEYDDYIVPDFIAPRSEYEFQFIGSISIGLLVRIVLKAGKTFLVNYIKNR